MRIMHEPLPGKLGSPENFVGSVWTSDVATPDAPSRLKLAVVRFAPGSRTAWHAHPLGQVLLITDGSGLVQRRGGTIESVRTGDTVVFEPGEWHWHGASPATPMTHVAIQEADADGLTAERGPHVTDADYFKA